MSAGIKSFLRGNWQDVFFILLICIGLYAASFYSGLLFHSLAELFSIAIALGVFLTVWGARRQSSSGYLLILGLGLASASLIDIAHTLAYDGMHIFRGYDANLPTQLWIAARSLQAGALLLAPFFLRHRLNLNLALASFTGVVLVLLGLIFSGYFPDCYIPGQGLTPFKIAAEYGIIIVALAAVIHHHRCRADLGSPGLALLGMAIAFTIASEIMLTRYIGVFDLTNQIGHIFKLIAYWWFYHAAVQIGFQYPYTNLQEGLYESEATYHRFIEHSRDGIMLTDEQGRIMEWNQAMTAITGISQPAALGRYALDILHYLGPPETLCQENYDLHAQEFQEALTIGQAAFLNKAYPADYRHQKSKVFAQIEEVWFTIPGRQGYRLGLIARDITIRKTSEETLRRQNEYLVALQETALEMISQLDLDTLLENIVRRAGQLVGTDAGLLDLVDPVTNKLKPHVGTGSLAESLEHPVQPGEGLAGTVWQTGTPLLVENYDQWPGRINKFAPSLIRSIVGVPLISEGRVLGVLGLAYDADSQSAFVQQDIELLQVFARFATIAIENARLYSLVQTELQERKRLQAHMIESAKLAGLGTLAAGMAHEINSPLQVITGLTGRLLKRLPAESPQPEKEHQDIGVIDRNAWRIAEIVRSLLLYARPPAENHATHDLNKIIGSALLLIDHKNTRFENVEIKQELQPGLPPCPCNHANITQMLINLLSNAADACSHGGVITIRSSFESWQNMLLLEVADTGSGVPPEIRERMFDPFFTTKEVGQGIGLGLSVVRGIVETHGGAIDVHSDAQHGTVVRVHLPVDPPPSEEKTSGEPVGRFD